MRTIAVYGGRFHGPHKGHKTVYDGLVEKFGARNVFVVTSGKQAPLSSPFTFEQKKFLWTQLDVPSDKIIQVVSPYNPKELTQHFNSEETAIVFALSEKDASRFTFKPKKNGDPSYMQPYQEPLQPLSKAGYVLVVPTVDFNVNGQAVKSASEIRNMYIKADDKTRTRILSDLYGKASNAIKTIYDKQLSLTETLLKLIDERNNLLYEGKTYSRLGKIIEKAYILERRIRSENT